MVLLQPRCYPISPIVKLVSGQPGARLWGLQAATSSGKPILLPVDHDAGHGFGSGKAQRDRELADEMSSALWQFGDPQFRAAAWTPPVANDGHP